VLTFEFGLNWGVYAHDVGPIIGVIIGMEVATAFFLEAGFIALWLVGCFIALDLLKVSYYKLAR
jgi:cytochrome bd ubiquinol oxidase subunit I